jgi:hypothetical protein
MRGDNNCSTAIGYASGGNGGGGGGFRSYWTGNTQALYSYGQSGTANTGGGGGGGSIYIQSNAQYFGSSGGSGVVVIRYPGAARASGGTITDVSGFTYHTFTSSGTFTPN